MSFGPSCFLKLFPILKIVFSMIKKHVWVGRSKLKRETYLSNPRLSLCTRMKIKEMNESPSKKQCVLLVLPLIWPHVLSGLIFRQLKNSSLRTFATEFAMESLMGAHPNDGKRSPPLFIAIVKRDESLLRFMCSFLLKSALESSQIPMCEGIVLWSNWTKPLTRARYGTKVRGRVVKCPRKYWLPWIR